jgi:CheY-like chemotaxis protein
LTPRAQSRLQLLQNSYSFVAEETRQVPKTLLAVDDSATMRKVLEITFSGDDFRVVTAASAQAALAKMSEEPSIVLIDTLLGSDDGYALCSEIRRRDPSATIVLLASRHNPYDPGKGRDSGADDFMDKPFDTQQMVDKVKKAAAARESGAGAQAAAPAAAPASVHRAPPAAASPAPPQAAPAQRPAAPAAGLPPERSRARTLMFGDRGTPGGPAQASPPADAPRDATPQPPAATAGHTKPSAAIYPPSRPQPQAPAAPPAAPPPAAARPAPAAPPAPKTAPLPSASHASPAASVGASVNGHLEVKLGELGLSQQQVEAVMALSREVVEKVVWEVVPQLAETLIKEEIARLTKEA